MLGTWKITPVYLELKDNKKPLFSQPYTVTRVHKAVFKKESERIVRLGVIKESNESKWRAPYFAQPKAKTNRVRFLGEFWNLNMQLKHKPYTMPKIHEVLLKV